MKPYISMPCIYRCRPGQSRMGQTDLAAIVTRVYDDGRADLMIFPPRTNIADALHYQEVAPMSDVVGGHCWHVPESDGLRRDDIPSMGSPVFIPKPGKPAKIKVA